MDLGYTQEVALVTGGTRGIGLCTARALLDEGCRVAVAGRSAAALDAAAAQLGSASGLILLEGDLLHEGTAARLVDEAVASLGRIDIVVNGAAAFTEGDVLDSPVNDWESLFRLKLVGYLEIIRSAVPVMKAQGQGCVLNIAGIAGLHPIPQSAHAGVVNAGVLNLTRLLARQLAGDGIRVNALSPGSVRTDRMETRIQRLMTERSASREDIEQMLAERVPTGQTVSVDEVAMVAVMMCSPHLRSMVGNNVVVDGGVTLS